MKRLPNTIYTNHQPSQRRGNTAHTVYRPQHQAGSLTWHWSARSCAWQTPVWWRMARCKNSPRPAEQRTLRPHQPPSSLPICSCSVLRPDWMTACGKAELACFYWQSFQLWAWTFAGQRWDHFEIWSLCCCLVFWKNIGRLFTLWSIYITAPYIVLNIMLLTHF